MLQPYTINLCPRKKNTAHDQNSIDEHCDHAMPAVRYEMLDITDAMAITYTYTILVK